jgi:hypothetical protein
VSGRLGVTPVGGGAPDGGAASPQWRLTEVGHIRRFGARFSMRFRPMAPQRRGKIISLTFEQWWAMAAAGHREAVQPKLEHGEGDLQCLLNDLDSFLGGGGPP